MRRMLEATMAVLLITCVGVTQDQRARGSEPIVDVKKVGNELVLVPPGAVNADKANHDVRKRRNENHNRPKGFPPQELPPGQEIYPEITHWNTRLPALPVEESTTIIVATVKENAAFLSSDQHTVYSEFELLVEQVLFSSGGTPISPGGSVTAGREGGAVRFRSGRIMRIRIHQQGFPNVGGRYLFFLKERPETSDYSIVTGYKLDGNDVYPLDGVGFGSERDLKFAKYEGSNKVEVLFADLNRALAERGKGTPR